MSNRAAWLVAKKAYPLEVRQAPYTEPKDDEVLIKVRYAAMNPGEGFYSVFMLVVPVCIG